MQHGNSFVDRFGDDKVINTQNTTLNPLEQWSSM